MKNLIFASAFTLATLAITNNATANTVSSFKTSETIENTMKPKIKIRLSWGDGGPVIEIEITFRTAPGGNDNETGTIDAKGITQSGVAANRQLSPISNSAVGKVSMQDLHFTINQKNNMLNRVSEIVVTKGEILPDGSTINVGDVLVLTPEGFSVKSPRDAASGLATGRRQ